MRYEVGLCKRVQVSTLPRGEYAVRKPMAAKADEVREVSPVREAARSAQVAGWEP